MKIVSILIAICISFNVMAASGTVQEFGKALDAYQYSLSVEWDQKDEAFLAAKTNEFSSFLKTAMAAGLSQEEILSFLESKVQNKKALESIKLKASLLSQGLSLEEMITEVKALSKDLYSQGSSWNGETIIGVGIAIVMIYFLAAGIHFELTHECVRTQLQYTCWDTGCYGEYHFCRTQCGYTDVCVEWTEK